MLKMKKKKEEIKCFLSDEINKHFFPLFLNSLGSVEQVYENLHWSQKCPSSSQRENYM